MSVCPICGIKKPRHHFYKSKTSKSGLQTYCKVCAIASAITWNQAHREAAKATQAAYYERQRKHNTVQYRATLAKNRKRGSEWKKLHADLRAAESSARRAIKLKATPRWANQEAIKEFYSISMVRKNETGESWDVDHIVPLKSPLVCGLHVEHNLRVIPSIENGRKWNKVWPDMP